MRKIVILSAMAFALVCGGSPSFAGNDAAAPAAVKAAPKASPATPSTSASKATAKVNAAAAAGSAAAAASSATPAAGSSSAAQKPTPNVDPQDAGGLLKAIVQAFRDGRWAWAIGLTLMLLTLLFNKLIKDKIPKDVVPWVAVGLGVATSIATSLASGASWLGAIGAGLTAGLAAIGGWEALGQHLFSWLKKKDPATASTTPST